MALPPVEGSSRKEQFLRFLLVELPPAIRELEHAVVELLDSGWEEPRRRRAHDIATALNEASVQAGLPYFSAIARSMSSLLGLRLEETISLQDALKEKLMELLELLKVSSSLSKKTARG